MEGDEMLELLEKAVIVVEERQDRLKKLDEAIRFSSGSRRDQVLQPRIELRGEIISIDGKPADNLRRLILYVNDQIAEIDEMLDSLRRA
jgi:hypothetical protein